MMFSLFLLTFAVGVNKQTLPSVFDDCKVQVFTSTQNQQDTGFQKIENGAGYVYFCNSQTKDSLLSLLVGVQGITYIIEGDFSDYVSIKKELDISCVESSQFACLGFSKSFDKSAFYDGKKVNVQMCYANQKIYVGTPLILGSYWNLLFLCIT